MNNVAFRIPGAMLTVDFYGKSLANVKYVPPQSAYMAQLLLPRWGNWTFFLLSLIMIDNDHLAMIKQHSITLFTHGPDRLASMQLEYAITPTNSP